MAIRFSCERCGHSIELDDEFAGRTGHCTHCGHTMTVPDAHPAEAVTQSADEHGPHLRPLVSAITPEEDRDPRLAPATNVMVRPLAPDEAARLKAHVDKDLDARDQRAPAVLDPYHYERPSRRFHLSAHYETRLARFLARILRLVDQWLYLVSVVFFAAVVFGFVFKNRAVLHIGAVGIIVTNLVMLVDAMAYLLVLPFRDSLVKGMSVILLPPYAIYYWVTRWDRMRKPVLTVLRSFTPILLVGLAYFFYEEAPLIRTEAKQVAGAVEKGMGTLDGMFEKGEKAAGIGPSASSSAEGAKAR
jgi:hypothetical protein